MGVPLARDTMPPPLPTPARPGGGLHLPTCVFARRKGHIVVRRHRQHAQHMHRAHSSGTGTPATSAMDAQLDKHAVQLAL